MLGLTLEEEDGGLLCLKDVAWGTPSAQLKRWQSRLQHGYLREIDRKSVWQICDVKDAVQAARANRLGRLALTLTHCEVPAGITLAGIPQLSMDHLNTIRHHLAEAQQDGNERICGTVMAKWVVMRRICLNLDQLQHVSEAQAAVQSVYQQLHDEVVQKERMASQEKLTRQQLLLRKDWGDWKRSEFKQLDQYNAQGMFGEPVLQPKGASVFHFV